MTKTEKLQNKIERCRTQLIWRKPFFGSVLMRLKVEAVPGLLEKGGVMGTNGKTLGFDPDDEDFAQWTENELRGVLAHEALHLLLEHHTRIHGRDHELWNIAGDFAINLMLVREGFKLPGEPLVDAVFDGMTADEIYNQLRQQAQQQAGGGGESNGDVDGQSQARRGAAKMGAVMPSLDKNGMPDRKAAEEWRQFASEMIEGAKMRGELPADLKRLLDRKNSLVEWRSILQRFIEFASVNDYTWSRPSRRMLWLGLYLPSLRSNELGDIVIAIDTSGSIGKELLDQFGAEVSGVLAAFDCTVHVVWIDARVHAVDVYTRHDLPLDLKPRGGGGTAFEPAFEWVEAEGLEPSCLIYLTDMCGSFPDEDPPYPTLWVRPPSSQHRDAPFGEHVTIEVK